MLQMLCCNTTLLRDTTRFRFADSGPQPSTHSMKYSFPSLFPPCTFFNLRDQVICLFLIATVLVSQ